MILNSYMQTMLERAMGRSSSTLSPGNRQLVAQTRELIQEIELLEEEVANRERHVLSLYRNIFDQCLSWTPSGQSSLMTSPAHIKNEVRKHPSIISSTFCSSKKFSLQPFQLLGSKKDSGKKNTLQQSKARHSILDEKTNIHIDSNTSDPAKVPEKVHTAVKNSLPVRTLKDHLCQCPSKLSEELVRCMAAINCWVCNAAPAKPENGCVPLESRSSTKVALPRQSVGGDQDCSWRSMMEISRILTDGNQHSRASYATSNYRVLVEQLERVNPSHMETDAKLAFWINVYNSLVMHAGYNIGGHIISANSIEHSILCCRSPRIGRLVENDKLRNGNREALTTLRKKARTTKTSVPSPFEAIMQEIEGSESRSLVKEVCRTCGDYDSKEHTWMMFPGSDVFARVPFHAAHTILEKDQERLDYEAKKLQSYVKEKCYSISEKGALADKISPGVLRSLVTLTGFWWSNWKELIQAVWKLMPN